MNAISLTNLGSKIIADFKKEFVIYDICGKSMKPLFKSEFSPKEGRILGSHSEEYLSITSPNIFFLSPKNDKYFQMWDLREGKPVHKLTSTLDTIRGTVTVGNKLYAYGKSATNGCGCNIFSLTDRS